MKTSIYKRMLCILAISLLCGGSAQAENWFMRDGTEDNTDKIYLLGLVQPTFQSDSSDPVHGLQGPLSVYNGDNTTLTNIGPSYDSTQSFYLFRVRFGVRGTVIENVNYEVIGEYGANALTTLPAENPNVELAEGSITFNHIPGMRLRAGIFKTPGPEESLRYAIEYVNFTNATQFLVNTQPYKKVSDVATDTYIATPRSGVRAFRDSGVEAFDAFQSGNHEFSYAFMIGNGNTLNKTDDNDRLSSYGRVQYSYLIPGQAHEFQRSRQDLTVFTWRHNDQLTFDDVDYDLTKSGVGLTMIKDIWQLNIEYMKAEGMLFLSPLFKNQPGGTLYASKDNEATGWYVDLGAFVTRNWLLGIRYDRLLQEPVDDAYTRELATTTFAAQYYFTKQVRIAFNYEVRDYDYGKQQLLSAQDASNITLIENSVDNRIAAQLTVKF